MSGLNSIPKTDVLIIGGGWAGLTSALLLSEQGFKVTLLEASPHFGGRARAVSSSVPNLEYPLLDNGQHLLMGAYEYTQAILNKTKASTSCQLSETQRSFKRHPFCIKSLGGKSYTLSFPAVKAPFHLILGLFFPGRLSTPSLGIKERFHFLRLSPFILNPSAIKEDIPLQDFLVKHQQSAFLMNHFWTPLAVAALSTDIKKASTRVFFHILNQCFMGENTHSDFLFATTDLTQLFVNPILNTLKSDYGETQLETHARVTQIQEIKSDNQNIGYKIQTKDKQYEAKHVIIATPWDVAQQLLSPFETCASIVENLSHFEHEEITTLYLRYAKKSQLHQPLFGIEMIHVQNKPYHFVFDRTQPLDPIMTLSAVITGPLSVDKSELLLDFQEFLKIEYQLKDCMEARAITQKRAAFSCTPSIQTRRPDTRTPQPGLWLTGDYCQTDYPASLEGAVKSAYLCVQQISHPLSSGVFDDQQYPKQQHDKQQFKRNNKQHHKHATEHECPIT